MLALVAQTPDFSAPGPYAYAYRIEDIPGTTETMRNSRIYYPDSAGVFPGSAVPAPIVAFGHGWMIGISSYYSYAQHLASWGYVVVLPTYSNPLIRPEHDKRARLMADAARWVAARDTVPGDHFFGRLDRWNWGFVGHSMGGSISMLAADTLGLHDTLQAVAALASPQSNPQTHSEHIIQPKLILAGGTDNIAPWRDVRQAFWSNAPAPGTFAVIRNAGHTDFMDGGAFIEQLVPPTPGRETTQLVVRRHLTAFFERHLQGDSSEWNFAYLYGDSILHHPTMDSVEVRLPPVGVEQPFMDVAGRFSRGPNPVRGRALVRYGLARAGRVSLGVYDAQGRFVACLVNGRRPAGVHHAVWNALDRDSIALPSGTYFVRLESDGQSLTQTLVLLR